MKKQIVGFFLAGAFMLHLLPGALAVGETITEKNRELAPVSIITDLEYENSIVFSSIEDAGTQLRTQVKNKASTVEILIPGVDLEDLQAQGLTPKNAMDSFQLQILYAAFKHTENPKEGAWLFFGISSYGCEAYMEGTTFHLLYTFDYHLSQAQEQELDSAVKKLVAQLGLTVGTEYQKIQKIYDYICQNVSYDYDHPDDYKLKYTAYAALLNKSAVCEGYSALLYRLAMEAGLDCRILENGSHVWNVVRVDGVYYYLDSTWDAGKTEYDWFLRGSINFIKDASHMTGSSDNSTSLSAWETVSTLAQCPISLTDYTDGPTLSPAQLLLQGYLQPAEEIGLM